MPHSVQMEDRQKRGDQYLNQSPIVLFNIVLLLHRHLDALVAYPNYGNAA